jgi:hypothetical protein
MADTLKLEIPHSTGGALDEMARRTFQGMAYFAGTGPQGSTCRECKFWLYLGHHYSNTSQHVGAPKPARCEKFSEMKQGDRGAAVPHQARACKYFSPDEKPPPAKAIGMLS